MALGLIGTKRIPMFTEAGASVPVTVVEATANRITQIKTQDTDGWAMPFKSPQVSVATTVSLRLKRSLCQSRRKAGRGLWNLD